MLRKVILFILIVRFDIGPCSAKSPLLSAEYELPLREFMQRASKTDPSFPYILIDEYFLKYKKDLELPVSDLVLEVLVQYNLFLPLANSANSAPWEGTLSLSKLFPKTGTSFSAGYNNSAVVNQAGIYQRSIASLELAQSVARNAFGILNRLTERKIEFETKVMRYQIIEAYEEYLGSLLKFYLDWYEQYENLKAYQAILDYNQKLFKLLKRKRSFGIAHPEDVQKMEFEITASLENIALLENDFHNGRRKIGRLSGLADDVKIVPQRPEISSMDSLEEDEGRLIKRSRTFRILADKKKALILARDIAQRNLLPALNFFMGYRAMGENINMQNSEHNVYGGISSGMNFGQQREKAALGVQKLELRKAELQRRKNIFDLELYLAELKGRLFVRKRQLEMSGKKLQLAESIMQAENRNYTQGRSTLNDLLLAKKNQENTRFEQIKIRLDYQSTLLEWLMATDQLVKKSPQGVILQPLHK